MKLFSLEGKTAFVTGAGSGIGQRIALGLAEAGASVGCFDLESKESKGLAIKLSGSEAMLGKLSTCTRPLTLLKKDLARLQWR
jgi:NAD(P)-dependent dehydrogenase (short-subunit alcohol dehydrogenase family)